MKRDVEFSTEDGTILRGVLRAPDAEDGAPGIVMAHGFSGVKEQLDDYAALFSDSGFSVRSSLLRGGPKKLVTHPGGHFDT
jgi:dienelactone hydrolase